MREARFGGGLDRKFVMVAMGEREREGGEDESSEVADGAPEFGPDRGF